jgi:hypothetical protein
MTGTDILIAVLAVAIGLGCLILALRMMSGLGRLGLLLVVLLAVLIGLGAQLPTWHQIADYLNPTRTEVNR